jgi:hypothetical protein
VKEKIESKSVLLEIQRKEESTGPKPKGDEES